METKKCCCCKEKILSGADRCKHCQSYQGWYRYAYSIIVVSTIIIPLIATALAFWQAASASTEANKAKEAVISASNAVVLANQAASNAITAMNDAKLAQTNAYIASITATNAALDSKFALEGAENAKHQADIAAKCATETELRLLNLFDLSAWDSEIFEDQSMYSNDPAMQNAINARYIELEEFAKMQVRLDRALPRRQIPKGIRSNLINGLLTDNVSLKYETLLYCVKPLSKCVEKGNQSPLLEADKETILCIYKIANEAPTILSRLIAYYVLAEIYSASLDEPKVVPSYRNQNARTTFLNEISLDLGLRQDDEQD